MTIQEALRNAMTIDESADNIFVGNHYGKHALSCFQHAEVDLDVEDILDDDWFIEVRR